MLNPGEVVTLTFVASIDIPFPAGWIFSPDEAPVLADSGMVVSTDEYASDAGVRILRAGGNAVEAAIATSFALADDFAVVRFIKLMHAMERMNRANEENK